MEENIESEIGNRRNQGGASDIGTGDDGAILEMININERLITIKEKSIYEFVLADTLDPKRERPNLPPSVHTKLVDRGSNDPLVARTFLTAKALFKRNHFPSSIDVNNALLEMLEVVKELVAMQTEIEGYLLEHNKACKVHEDRHSRRGFMLPAVPDMLTRCKTIFQKADQACQYLMDVIRMFYREISENEYYTNFEDLVKAKYGPDDPFSKFLHQAVQFIMVLRRARNCLDHRKTELRLAGFELQDDGNILSPTIEMNHLGSVIGRQDLATFLSDTMNALLQVIELTLPYLASKHIEPMGLVPVHIREVPESNRYHKMIRFGIWMPIDEEGIYLQ